jgi:hypothetical protein
LLLRKVTTTTFLTYLWINPSANKRSAGAAASGWSPAWFCFSTKKGGQGIGLVFVREVLNRHGFPYRLEASGHGETRFEIAFSAAA